MKSRFGLTSDTAGDLKGAVYAMSAVIVAMDPGWDRSLLIALFLIVMAIISYLTVGNIPPDEAAKLMGHEPTDYDIAEALKRGRE